VASSSNVTIRTADGDMPAYRATPTGSPRGGVVVVQEAFGITSHIEDVAGRFAAAGYLALAPALFHRQGSPVLSYADMDPVRDVMAKLTGEGLRMDVAATLAALDADGQPARRCAVVGFCMGGSVTVAAAAEHALGAAVTFYGGGVREGRFGLAPLLELVGELHTPWLGLYGDRDTGIPAEQVEELRAAAAGSGVPTEVVRYPEAQHGFGCDDRPAVFDPTASADAWQRTFAWLDQHLRR
jgi:carboxymethylenebutenolidase